MKYTLIYADDTGSSHLCERDWAMRDGTFTPPSPAGYEVSDTCPATGVLMMHHPAGYRDEWHCAPSLVLGTVLAGTVRIDASSGTCCVLHPGDQFVAADLSGDGHKIEEVNFFPYSLAIVVLDNAAGILPGVTP